MVRLTATVGVLFTAVLLYAGDGHVPTILHQKQFAKDAARDAQRFYAGRPSKSYVANEFDVYRQFKVDLDGDSTEEYVVAGRLLAKDVNYVIAYFWQHDQWFSTVLNRSLGGDIVDVKVIDLDRNGVQEIYSVLKDENLKRYCRICEYIRGDTNTFYEVFKFDTDGGLKSSYNISLAHPSEVEPYKVRIDEVQYPDDDQGDVHQRTYYYRYYRGRYELENVYSGRP